MTNLSIVVEGAEDVRFLQDFIQFHFGRKIEREAFIEVDGKTEKLFKAKSSIRTSTDGGKTNLLIFDADDKDYESTLGKVKSECDKLSLIIDAIFLFPNNESKGNLESLLRECIPAENKALLDCIKQYEACKKNLASSTLRIIDSKEELFIYHGSFDSKIAGKAKATERNYSNPTIWNLDSPNLAKLKEFLSQYFT